MNQEDRGTRIIDDLRRLYAKHLRASQYHNTEAHKVEAALKALGHGAAVMASSEMIVGNGAQRSPSLATLNKAESLTELVRTQGPIPIEKMMHELSMGFGTVKKVLAQGPFERTEKGWIMKTPVSTS